MYDDNNDWTDSEMGIATDELLALVDDLEQMSKDIKRMAHDNGRAEPLIASDLLKDAAAAVRGAAIQVSLMRGLSIQQENI